MQNPPSQHSSWFWDQDFGRFCSTSWSLCQYGLCPMQILLDQFKHASHLERYHHQRQHYPYHRNRFLWNRISNKRRIWRCCRRQRDNWLRNFDRREVDQGCSSCSQRHCSNPFLQKAQHNWWHVCHSFRFRINQYLECLGDHRCDKWSYMLVQRRMPIWSFGEGFVNSLERRSRKQFHHYLWQKMYIPR